LILDGENHRQPTTASPAAIGYPAIGAALPIPTGTPIGATTGRMAIVPGFAAPAVFNPTHDQIAALAHSYWETRGRHGGSAEADWLRAEQQLRGR
jgi:hypothetical protein